MVAVKTKQNPNTNDSIKELNDSIKTLVELVKDIRDGKKTGTTTATQKTKEEQERNKAEEKYRKEQRELLRDIKNNLKSVVSPDDRRNIGSTVMGGLTGIDPAVIKTFNLDILGKAVVKTAAYATKGIFNQFKTFLVKKESSAKKDKELEEKKQKLNSAVKDHEQGKVPGLLNKFMNLFKKSQKSDKDQEKDGKNLLQKILAGGLIALVAFGLLKFLTSGIGKQLASALGNVLFEGIKAVKHMQDFFFKDILGLGKTGKFISDTMPGALALGSLGMKAGFLKGFATGGLSGGLKGGLKGGLRGGLIGAAGSLALSTIIDESDNWGERRKAAQEGKFEKSRVAKEAGVPFFLTATAAGATFGPWGAAVGALVGAMGTLTAAIYDDIQNFNNKAAVLYHDKAAQLKAGAPGRSEEAKQGMRKYMHTVDRHNQLKDKPLNNIIMSKGVDAFYGQTLNGFSKDVMHGNIDLNAFKLTNGQKAYDSLGSTPEVINHNYETILTSLKGTPAYNMLAGAKTDDEKRQAIIKGGVLLRTELSANDEIIGDIQRRNRHFNEIKKKYGIKGNRIDKGFIQDWKNQMSGGKYIFNARGTSARQFNRYLEATGKDYVDIDEYTNWELQNAYNKKAKNNVMNFPKLITEDTPTERAIEDQRAQKQTDSLVDINTNAKAIYEILQKKEEENGAASDILAGISLPSFESLGQTTGNFLANSATNGASLVLSH